jgi:hypothetical protein
MNHVRVTQNLWIDISERTCQYISLLLVVALQADAIARSNYYTQEFDQSVGVNCLALREWGASCNTPQTVFTPYVPLLHFACPRLSAACGRPHHNCGSARF